MLPVIPSIRITPASPGINPSAELDVQDDDGYRSKWLSLPPNPSQWHTSPLHPVNCPPGQGLSRDQFDSLLKVSRDQRAKVNADLRSQSALENQTLKQQTVERRTHFLSKIKQLSCPVTISIPNAPLRSPLPVCCSMPSHGFASEFPAPKVAVENAQDFTVVSPSTDRGWDEHGLPILHFPPAMPKISRHVPPTLDEITTRLKPAHRSRNKDCSQSRLPLFLKAQRLSSGSAGNQVKLFPIRSLALNDERFNTTFAQQNIHSPSPELCTSEIEAYSYSSCAQ